MNQEMFVRNWTDAVLMEERKRKFDEMVAKLEYRPPEVSDPALREYNDKVETRQVRRARAREAARGRKS